MSRFPGLLSLLLLFSTLSPALGAEERAEIEIAFMNATYTDLDQGLAPVRRGGLEIHISSPEHRITVHGNHLVLAGGDGLVDAELAVDFEGAGRIIADLKSGAGSSRFQDRVEAPRQTVTVRGRARLEKVETGYLMTVVDSPDTVDLRIKSDLGQQVVSLCRTFEKLPIFAIDCSGIDAAFSVVTVPLPEPGEQFLVPGAELTVEEKVFFDRFAR